jgi:hypothetical protein
VLNGLAYFFEQKRKMLKKVTGWNDVGQLLFSKKKRMWLMQKIVVFLVKRRKKEGSCCCAVRAWCCEHGWL